MPRAHFTVAQWFDAVMSRGVVSDSCRLWPGRKNAKGYGRVRVPPELAEVLGLKPRSPAMVHRAIYAYHHFLATDQHMNSDPIDHMCCNAACFHLPHLRHVSHAVNQRHAVEVRMYGKTDSFEEENNEWF